MRKPVVFISYSHKDEEWKDRLVGHLGVSASQGLLATWNDRQIGAGEDWERAIQEKISSADLAILLVSANSLTSKFILGEEVIRLLKRRGEEGLRIFPVIIKPCDWSAVDWLKRMNLRPLDGRAISGGNDHQIDTDLTMIAREVREFLQAFDPAGESPAELDVSPAIPEIPLVDLRSIRPFAGQLKRIALFQPFEDFARCRDIVFALGGVGSGLKTFLDQFGKFLENKTDRQLASADFDPEVYRKIHEARTLIREALEPLDYIKCNDYARFDLKCLLATLAYTTYDSLHQHFARELDKALPGSYSNDPVRFAEYYFASSSAMVNGNIEPIVAHFFSTVQKLAVAIATEGVMVFMPWSELAACFTCRSDNNRLATELWDALAAFAIANDSGTAVADNYDKVCLIVAASEVPYASQRGKEKLVRKSVWPIPPLDVGEITDLLGMISPELSDPTLADTLIEWTGGAPWYVRLVLSCAQYLSREDPSRGTPLRGQALIETACSTAERILAGGHGRAEARGDLEKFVRKHLDAVREALGDVVPTDKVIEEAWAGPEHEWKRGLKDASPRVEAFVRSGLIWLGGDPSDPAMTPDIFRRYPTLFFRRAGHLPLAAYRSVTGGSLELAGY